MRMCYQRSLRHRSLEFRKWNSLLLVCLVAEAIFRATLAAKRVKTVTLNSRETAKCQPKFPYFGKVWVKTPAALETVPGPGQKNVSVARKVTANGHLCRRGSWPFIIWQRRSLQALESALMMNFPSSERKFYLLSLQSKRSERVMCSWISIQERRKWIGVRLPMEPWT